MPDAQTGHAMRQKDDGERQETHTPEEVGLATPEEQSVRHALDVGEDGGAGGGVARHHLEERIGERGDRPVQDEWQGRDRGDDDPAEGRDNDGVPGVENVPVRELQAQREADGARDGGRDRQSHKITLSVDHGDQGGGEHGNTGDDQKRSHDIGDAAEVHRRFTQ